MGLLLQQLRDKRLYERSGTTEIVLVSVEMAAAEEYQ